MKTKKPSFEIEKLLFASHHFVFGLDEVGRGSFAGPLVACAVSFKKEYKFFKQINDSKLLAHKKRVLLSRLIKRYSDFFIESIGIDEINSLGIEKCNRLIFEKLIANINKQYKRKQIMYLIDGRNNKQTEKNIAFVIKGDQKHISIAAASIIAKVHRDYLMNQLEKQYPGYYFSKNKGYGTKAHREAIKKYGLSLIHRSSFKLEKFL